jgi:hypothetical protein
MKKLFVKQEVAFLAKEKLFDGECLSAYYSNGCTEDYLDKYVDSVRREVGMKLIAKAPIHQQVVNWLEEKHNIHVSRIWYNDSVTPTRWVYHIDGDYAGSDFDEALIQALNRIK